MFVGEVIDNFDGNLSFQEPRKARETLLAVRKG